MRSGPGPTTGAPFSRIVTFDRLDEAGHGLEQAGLAATRGPQKHETVASVDLENRPGMWR